MGQTAPAPVVQRASPAVLPGQAALIEIEGSVEVSRAGSPLWDPARANQPLLPGDRVRTGDRSRAVIRLSDQTVLRQGTQTILQIPEPGRSGIRLLKGLLFYFHRDKPRDFPVVTPSGYAAIVGTEFSVQVEENTGATTLHIIDGQVELTNSFGQLRLATGESARMEANAAPARTAAMDARRAVRWCLYYPGVLRFEDLAWPHPTGNRVNTGTPPDELTDSIRAYRAGDVLRALAAYPIGRRPASDAERVYLAGLLLAAGEVDRATDELAALTAPGAVGPGSARLGAALQRVVTSTSGLPRPDGASPDNSAGATAGDTATELLAGSYAHQAAANLEAALREARAAVTMSPDFAFAWIRVAELEFSFGRVDDARRALARGLELAPRQAEAHALQGFLWAAENRVETAIAEFEQAIALDGALGNAWLGRGLCRIRRGDLAGGRSDLHVAVTVEPHRAVLRSYLAKAYADSSQWSLAEHELSLAHGLDDADPTVWLYSALLNQRRNRINDGVRDLERSRDLNDQRAVYRSRLLLDQDRAVRGANLANLLGDVGLTDVSIWEAAQAANVDYANPSAHLFLANSFDGLRDPGRINLRYETPWLSEFLVANLLAPIGAGPLSPYVTRQEYSKLFERDRLGIVSSTEYRSSGDWIQSASQFGQLGNSAYALDLGYRSERGERPNDDLRELTTALTWHQQLNLRDTVLLRVGYEDAESGDLNLYYDPRQANRQLRIGEVQEASLLAGVHHVWQPGLHTLVLAGRVHDRLEVDNPRQDGLALQRNAGQVTEAYPLKIEQRYRSSYELYTVEAQQIVQHERISWIIGGRFQTGEFDTGNRHANAQLDDPVPPLTRLIVEGLVNINLPSLPRHFDPGFRRLAAYSYLHVQPADSVQLIGGLTFDELVWPENHRFAPLSADEEATRRVSPKVGLLWTPTRCTTVRGAYTRGLTGASLDQSYQLEPTQVAGFVQTYRSLIPESVEGANAAASLESWNASIEQRLLRGTYLGWSGEILRSHASRNIGAYNVDQSTVSVSATPKHLNYEERALALSISQLLGSEWSVGTRYRISQATLNGRFVEIGPTATRWGGLERRTAEEATLQEVTGFIVFNHPSGFFAQGQARWLAQQSDVVSVNVRDEDFWQFDAWVGWRFLGRRVEATAGVLNISDRDYRLYPLNLTARLPRERTFFARLRFSF